MILRLLIPPMVLGLLMTTEALVQATATAYENRLGAKGGLLDEDWAGCQVVVLRKKALIHKSLIGESLVDLDTGKLPRPSIAQISARGEN